MWRYELRREDNCAQVSAPFPQRHEKVPTQSDSLILCIFFLSISYLSQFVDNLPPFLIISSLSLFFDNLSQSLDCWQSFSSGGDGNLPRPRRWAGLGAHQGGQNHPQGESLEPAMKEFTYKENICSGDEKVPGRRSRSINGPALRGSLSKHPITGEALKRKKWCLFYLIFVPTILMTLSSFCRSGTLTII